MVRALYKDLICRVACSFSFFFLLFSGYTVANKEGYYGKYIGKLSQLHHGVSGDVFAVDARTLHIRNFNYDGEGPAAYFYAGNSKAPGVNGFRLRDERGTTNVLPRYRNKHVTITLPEGKTLQNVRWFSVWCDEFSVNFGDVKIPKNLDFPKPQKISGLSGVHGVSSEPIVIVDAQTLLIPSFSYDGEAPDAKFWVGRGFKPSPQGIRIPDENGKELPLRRYDRKTIVLTLPGDLTIFDIGHFGVWCEAFTVDFGHVQIPRGLNIPPSLKMLGVSPQKRSPPIAVPFTVQSGFDNHFGSRQTTEPRVHNPIFYQDFNAQPKIFQDIRPTTYKPSLLTSAPPSFANININVDNRNSNGNHHSNINVHSSHKNYAFEIQKSISLPPNNEFVINEQTGDFVKKPFDLEYSRRQDIRYEPTPAEKIFRYNPTEPVIARQNDFFQLTPRPVEASRQPIFSRSDLFHSSRTTDAADLVPPAFSAPQPPPHLQLQFQHRLSETFDGRASNHFGTLFDQQNDRTSINHSTLPGLNAFSRVTLNRSPGQGSFHQTFSKLNCEVLWDDFAYEVRWAVAGDSIVLQLVARLENNEYMSFGLSGDRSRSRMVGGDVVVAWVDKESLKGYAKDYYLDAKSQCSGGRGSCPDENIEVGAESVRLLNAALVNGYSIVTFQRSLKAQDDFDKDVFTNASQPVIWAIGPLNSRREVSYHSLANRGDIFIDFGRAPKWNCPTPESVPDQSEPHDPTQGREYEVRIKDPNIQDTTRRESQPKSQLPTPAPAPKTTAWEIPPIKCYEPEDGVFYAQMGPTGGKHGYSAITGHVGWGISWYINGLLIPEINVVRGRTYTFIVEGGLDPETPARYHPFYITDDPVGGYQYKTSQERANIQIFAGAVQNKRGEVRPTGIGRLCNWTPDPNAPPADEFSSFGAYQRTLRLECDPGNPGIIQWTVEKDTPDTVYYQCYTHRYLGWKINVHDHCEGEASSDPVPSILKAPTSVVKSHEVDSEGSASINLEIRVKPSPELLKNILEKDHTNLGPNGLGSFGANVKYSPQFLEKEELNGSKNEFELKAPAPVKQHMASKVPQSQDFQNSMQESLLLQQHVPDSFVLGSTFAEFSKATLLKPSGYSVIEEPVEGNIQQNFHILPALQPERNEMINKAHQIFSPKETVRTPEKLNDANIFHELTKNLEILRAPAEEKLKRNNQKLSYQNKSPEAPARFRKPPSLNPLTLQQRPFPPGAFRPPPLFQKLKKRPVIWEPHKTLHNIYAKPPYSHQHMKTALGSEELSKQETQTSQIANPPNKYHQSYVFGSKDLFGISTVSKPVSPVTFAQNNGFDPQSVQVEGGFKPILNTGIAHELTSGLTDRSDSGLIDDEDDGIGVIGLIKDKSSREESLIKGKQEGSEMQENEEKTKKIDLFRNQKPQKFDPIFIPSYPDESVKKYQEKLKKKTVLNLKTQQSGQVHIKIRPMAEVRQRPLYPDAVVPPFNVWPKGGIPQLRSKEPNDFDDRHSEEDTKNFSKDTSNKILKAENILEVLEMYDNKSITTTSEIDAPTEEKIPIYKPAQDEISMADERKDFYLPPNGNEFLSYNGKIVKGIDAPTLPEASPSADVSKLPQFVPFKGVIPPLTQFVNAKNLPQLKASKLARHDILPPTNVGDSTSRISSHSEERKKRSPDHVSSHKEHDHHSHHQSHHNGGSSNASNLFQIAFVNFTLMYLQKYIAFLFL